MTPGRLPLQQVGGEFSGNLTGPLTDINYNSINSNNRTIGIADEYESWRGGVENVNRVAAVAAAAAETVTSVRSTQHQTFTENKVNEVVSRVTRCLQPDVLHDILREIEQLENSLYNIDHARRDHRDDNHGGMKPGYYTKPPGPHHKKEDDQFAYVKKVEYVETVLRRVVLRILDQRDGMISTIGNKINSGDDIADNRLSIYNDQQVCSQQEQEQRRVLLSSRLFSQRQQQIGKENQQPIVNNNYSSNYGLQLRHGNENFPGKENCSSNSAYSSFGAVLDRDSCGTSSANLHDEKSRRDKNSTIIANSTNNNIATGHYRHRFANNSTRQSSRNSQNSFFPTR